MWAFLEQRVGEELQVLRVTDDKQVDDVLGGSQWDLCWDGGNSDDPKRHSPGNTVTALKVTKVLIRYENRI